MFSYAARVSKPYSDLSGIIDLWAQRCEQVAVFQHDADEEVTKTHVHLVLLKCDVKAEQLKRDSKLPAQGNKLWSFKDHYEDKDKNWVPVDLSFITYMSKGFLEPVFLKNISQDIVDGFRQKWVDPVKDDKSGSSTEYYIRKVLSRFPGRPVLPEDDLSEGRDYDYKSYYDRLLEEFRHASYAMLYHERKIIPPATLYKQVAGSAFIRKCEELGNEEAGLSRILDLWY